MGGGSRDQEIRGVGAAQFCVGPRAPPPDPACRPPHLTWGPAPPHLCGRPRGCHLPRADMALDPTGTGREAGVTDPRGRAAGVGQGAGWRWRGAEAAPPSRVPGARPAGPRREGSGMVVRLWLADVSPLAPASLSSCSLHSLGHRLL